MIAQTDDAALRLKDVWKGNDSFTIPFDARYGAWAAGIVMSTLGTILAFRITTAFRTGGTPGGLLLTAIVLGACTAAAFTLRAMTRKPRVMAAPFMLAPFFLLTLGPTATAGGPAGALLALTSAVVVGVGGSIALVRTAGRHVDAVTPLRYQIAVFRAETTAPRPVPPVARAATGPVHIETVNMVAHPVTGPRTVLELPAPNVAHTVTGPRPVREDSNQP